MKKVILLFLSTLVVSSCIAQKSAFHNDLFFDHFKGAVQSAKTIPYVVNTNGQMGEVDSCCVTLLEYDNWGYRTLELNQDPMTKEMNGQVYTKRHSNGKPKEIQFRMNGIVVSTLFGTLDKKGNYNDTKVFNSAGKLLSFYADVKVNRYGKIVSMKEFRADSTLLRTIENKYDKQIWVGGLVKDSSGRKIFSTVIRLSKAMNPIEMVETQQTDNGPSVTITKYVYEHFDEHGNWVQRREFDDKRHIRKIVKREIHYRNQ